MTDRRAGRGFSLVEVIVVVMILSLLVLAVLATLPRRLEVARRTTCQRNLMQIGVALVLYDQATGQIPAVPELSSPASRETSPLRALLERLGLPDFLDLADPKSPPPTQPGLVVKEQPIRGFVCASDPDATAGAFPAPISYRATAGDTPDGRGGSFSPARRLSLAAIEAGDGTAYTAAFSERLVGSHRPVAGPRNYCVVPAPLPPDGCPRSTSSAWREDAGASWFTSSWQSTLYHHARPPDAAPSCITEDGRSAFMGASSGHPAGVNVLLFDGSVKVQTPTIDPRIWRALATPGTSAGPEPPAAAP